MQLFGAAHRHRPGAGLLERAQVLGHVALQGEHSDDGSSRASSFLLDGVAALREEAGAARR